MDRFDRAATASEISAMRQSLETSLDHGAIGLSTGLYYPPANAAPTEEVIALGKTLHKHGGIHTTHMRDEASQLVQSVNETIAIGRSADIPVVISHHNSSGTPNHGLVDPRPDRRASNNPDSASTSTPRCRLDHAGARRIPLSKIIVTWSKSLPNSRETLDTMR